MKRYLYDDIEHIDKIIKEDRVSNQLVEEHLIKIKFFQHERVIHLFVTLTYALLFFMSLIVSIYVPIFRIIGIILCFFLIPYVLHYFKLENGVQYLYKQYDMMREKK